MTVPQDSTTHRYAAPDLHLLEEEEEVKRRPLLAWFLLGCIFTIVFRHTILVRPRSIFQADVVDALAAVDITAVLLAGVVLLATGAFFQAWQRLGRSPVKWLTLYYALCALSFLWSFRPLFSLYRAVEYIVLMWATITVVVQQKDFEAAEKNFCRIAVFVILLELAQIVRLTGFGWSLGHWHTTTYSIIAGMICCYCLGEYLNLSKHERQENPQRVKRLTYYGIFAFFMLALGTSAGSNIATAIGCLLILFGVRRYGLLLACSFLTLLLFFWGGGAEMLRHLLFPLKDEVDIELASGRWYLWEFLWERFLEKPIVGHGFGVAGFLSEGLASHTHNGYLTILLGTGIIGFCCFIIFFLSVWLRAGKVIWRKKTGALGSMAALTVVFINNITLNVIGDRWISVSVAIIYLLVMFSLYIIKNNNIEDTFTNE